MDGMTVVHRVRKKQPGHFRLWLKEELSDFNF